MMGIESTTALHLACSLMIMFQGVVFPNYKMTPVLQLRIEQCSNTQIPILGSKILSLQQEISKTFS